MPHLTFNDQPLLFDWQYETGRFKELYQRLDETVLNGLFPHRYTWQTSAISKNVNVGLPIVLWPEAPPLKLNQLYYPVTGASRWAEGIFLCNGETKNKIDTCRLAKYGGSLEIGFAGHPSMDSLLGEKDPDFGLTDATVTITMHPLEFRRIGGCREAGGYDPDGLLKPGDEDDFDLYLVHFVDERYWWQFIDAPEACEQEDGWYGKIAYFLSRLEVTLNRSRGDTPTLPSAYDTGPHPSEWNRAHHNAAQLLDAALESIGYRFVSAPSIASYDPTTNYSIQRYEEAEEEFQANLSNMSKGGLYIHQIAGTDCEHAFTRALPDKVKVVFPKSRYGMLCAQCNTGYESEDNCHEDYYTIEKRMDEYLDADIHCEVRQAQKTIFVRGWADMGGCGSISPINYRELSDLANQIAEDWYKYRLRQYDFTLLTVGWRPTGYDDAMIIKCGVEYEDDLRGMAVAQDNDQQARDIVSEVILQQQHRRDCTWRIQSLPINIGADTQLHDTNAVELTASTFAQIPSEAITPSRMFCDTYSSATGTLCNAYRTKGDASCGPLTPEAVVYRNASNLGQQYKILVFNISDYCTSASTTQGQPIMVRATECTLPGNGGIAQPQQWNSSTKCWEDSSASPITVIDPMGWLMAVPGDCFKVEPSGTSGGGTGTNGCDLLEVRPMECCAWRAVCITGQLQETPTSANEYMPSFPFGMTQLVRVPYKIECGDCGEVTIIRKATTPGDQHCDTVATECTFQACNMSYRPISCDAQEYAIAHITPGECCLSDPASSSAGEERCIAFLMPYPRPMFAIGKIPIGVEMCGDSPALEDVGFLDVCDDYPGSPPTAYSNPMELHACEETKVLLLWCTQCGQPSEELPDTCGWVAFQVADYELPDWMLDIQCDTDVSGNCKIQKQTKVEKRYGHFCRCSNDISVWSDTLVAGTTIEIVEGIDTTTGVALGHVLTSADCGTSCELSFGKSGIAATSLTLKMRSVCVLCTNEAAAPVDLGYFATSLVEAIPDTIAGHEIDVVTGIALKTEVTSDGGGDEVNCDTTLGLNLVLTGTTKRLCVFCSTDGLGAFQDGEDVALPLKFAPMEPITEANFYCDPCVGLDVKTTQFYALCIGIESAATSVACSCYDCPPESA